MSVIDNSIGVVLAQLDEEGKERAMYYLSKFFNEVEKRYMVMEKTYVGVVWVTQKLKYYFLTHKVKLIAKIDPIK